jgi:hypothetical protein
MPRPTERPAGFGEIVAKIANLERGLAREANRRRMPIAPVLADVGRVTVADGDFDNPPDDGTVAVLVNTTDNTTRLAVRAAGVWRVSAALS